MHKHKSGGSGTRLDVQVDLEEGHADVISECVRAYSPMADGPVVVRALDRVGFSDARLYLCFPQKNARPFVAKVDRHEKIAREHKALESVKLHFPIEGYGTAQTARLGAILYPHAGGTSVQQMKESWELQKLTFQRKPARHNRIPEKFQRSDASLVSMYKHLFRVTLQHPRAVAVDTRFDVAAEYERYVRRSLADPVAHCLLGDSKAYSLMFLGAEIANPIRTLKWVLDHEMDARMGPVHGDVHPNNVIIGADNRPHLIDYARAHPRGHLLKDYALMESSLRFALFPHHVNLEDQLSVDEQLLDYDGAKLLSMYQGGGILDIEYRRLGKILEVVREYAMNAAGPGGWTEYLKALFIVLYGNLAYPVYNRHTALRALGLIANRLESSKSRRHRVRK